MRIQFERFCYGDFFRRIHAIPAAAPAAMTATEAGPVWPTGPCGGRGTTTGARWKSGSDAAKGMTTLVMEDMEDDEDERERRDEDMESEEEATAGL